MIDNREVGRRIARLRQERGLTQMQLAAMMNVSHQAVSKWESGAAMPDIQTLLELTRFFGLTVEQMTGADLQEEPMAAQEDEESSAPDEPKYEEDADMDNMNNNNEKNSETEAKCTMNMNLKQLLQMAPFMSKEAVAEVALRLDGPLPADDIVKLAPFLPQEGMEALLEKHHPELTWETLRKLAPFMRRETVDKLVRSIADGEQKVSGSADSFDRTMDGLGRAFNGLGRGVDKAVRQALRLGESIVNEVGSALGNLGKDAKDGGVEADDGAEPAATTDRAKELRRRAFERALDDGRWDWLAEHIDELEDGDELKLRIAQRARELGMTDWLDVNMGESGIGAAAEAALSNGDLEWLGQHIDELSSEQQLKALHLAVQQHNWGWLEDAADDIDLEAQIEGIVREVWHGGNAELAVQLAEENFDQAQLDAFFREAADAGDRAVSDPLWEQVSPDCAGAQLLRLAGQGDWAQVKAQLEYANRECLEGLMELAVDQGNFDAIDFLNDEL